MSTILCNISAERLESISALVGTDGIKLSVTNISTIPLGSTLSIGVETATIVRIEDGVLYFYKVPGSAFTPVVGENVFISSIFRFSNDEIVVSNETTDFYYEGRLTVNSINESFGSFIDKKQIISNATVSLINTDGKISSIFHSYDLPNGATVDMYVGTGTDLNTYELFFSGITNSNSNFRYDDITFSFSAKDNRATLLNTSIPNSIYDADQFPKYATHDISTPIISILCTAAIPSEWVTGTPIKVGAAGSATVTYVSGSTIYAHSYTGTIAAANTLTSDIYPTTSATVSTVTAPYGIISGTGLTIKGDTGHNLGLVDDQTPSNINIGYTSTSNYNILYTQWNYSTTWYGQTSLASTSPVHYANTKTTIMTTAGYLKTLKMNVSVATGMLGVDGYISVNGGAEVKVNLQAAAATGAKEFDLETLATPIQVRVGDRVSFRLFGTTLFGNRADANGSFWHLQVNTVTVDVIPNISLGGTYEATIPVDLVGNGVNADGKLFFTRSNSVDANRNNNCQIFCWVSSDNFSTVSEQLSVIGSGVTVPKADANANAINAIRYRIIMTPPTNFKDDVSLYGLYCAFPTASIVGSELSSGMDNATIPLIYGDFTDTYLPATKINTSLNNGIGASYTFSNLTGITNALSYTVPTEAEALAIVGDSIEYIEQGGTEKIYAKVTQIIITTTTSGTIYFEDFSILPDTTSAITVARETNTYKLCDNPLVSIDAFKYLPSSAKDALALPSNVTVQKDLAAGQFTLIGSNLSDTIFATCTGKPNPSTGVLIESPIAIIKDLLALTGQIMNVVVKGETEAELASLKMRRYISDAEPFSDLLSTVEADANIHSYIDATNTMTLIRFTNTLVHDRTYYDSNVVPDSFNEEYDPAGIRVNNLTFLYKDNPEVEVFSSSYSLGDGSSQNTQEMPWLWRDQDATLIGDQIFNIVKKTPELIHVIIAADDALTIKLGDVVRMIYTGSYHSLFVYNTIKNPLRNEIEIYGWNLAHGYDIDFPIQDLAEFPTELQTGPYTYSPWLLTNKSALGKSGVFDIHSVAHEPPLIPTTTLINDAGVANTINTTGTMCLVFQLPNDMTINFNKTIAGGQVTISTCTTAQHAGNTGARLTDTKTDRFTYTSTGVRNVNVVGTDGDYVYIYIDTTRIADLEAYWPTDSNIASDRYNWWNSDWPYANKKYFLSRHQIAGLPPTGFCINVDGSLTENIQLFKDR